MDFIITNSTLDPTTGCWVWNRSVDGRGYAVYGQSGIRIARFAWELKNKKEMLGECACHSCDHKPCVNPDHIFEGSQLDNMRDYQAKKAHCSHHYIAL